MSLEEIFSRFSARRRFHRSVSLWYHPDYDVPSLSRSARVRGLVPDRGKKILAHLIEEKIIKASDIHPPPLCRISQLRLFHTEDYLEEAGQSETLGRIFGLEPDDIHLDELLRAQRRAVGGTLAAAQAALKGQGRIGFNLGGGFHHAEPDQGAGFCVYNDIAVTIAQLRRDGFKKPIAIVDLDFHQGNGNVVAFAGDPGVAVYSLHGSVWTHLDAQNEFNIHIEEKVGDEKYLKTIRDTLPRFLEIHQPRLLFYIAGNDVLADDPLGGFDLSLEGVAERDEWVMLWAGEHKVPLVITLGGGYSQDACRATLNLLFLLCGYEKQLEHPKEEDLHKHFLTIAKGLKPEELQKESEHPLKFTEADLVEGLHGHWKQRRVLGYYSAYGIELALDRYGVLQKIRDLGYSDFKVTVDPSDPSHQMVRLEARPSGSPRAKRLVLAEVVVHKESLSLPTAPPGTKAWEMLSVEWLLLQDPLKSFSAENPPFPGQAHPGLGISKEIEEILILICLRLHLDGILFRPSHYHIAQASESGYRFYDPKDQGRFQAFQEVLKGQALFEASRWVMENQLVLGDRTPVPWKAKEFVYPVTKPLKDYFDSRHYIEAALEEKYRILESGLHIQFKEASS